MRVYLTNRTKKNYYKKPKNNKYEIRSNWFIFFSLCDLSNFITQSTPFFLTKCSKSFIKEIANIFVYATLVQLVDYIEMSNFYKIHSRQQITTFNYANTVIVVIERYVNVYCYFLLL